MAEPDAASRQSTNAGPDRAAGPDTGRGPDAGTHTGPGPEGAASGGARPAKRPLLERLGMAAIALVLAALFVVVAVAGYAGGELFIAGMGAIGALMTLWVGGLTLLRG